MLDINRENERTRGRKICESIKRKSEWKKGGREKERLRKGERRESKFRKEIGKR